MIGYILSSIGGLIFLVLSYMLYGALKKAGGMAFEWGWNKKKEKDSGQDKEDVVE